MATIDTIRRLQAFKKNPSMIKPPENDELAELVLEVMTHVQAVNKMVAEGKMRGEPGTPARNLVPDVDYVSAKTAQKQLNDVVSNFEADLRAKGAVLESRVRKALDNIRSGDDGIVTDEEIERAATLALERVKELLPNVEEKITASPQAVRDALELLQGDERLRIEDIHQLAEALEELRVFVRNIAMTRGGNGIGKNQVYDFIRQAVADGTIAVADKLPLAGGTMTGAIVPADHGTATNPEVVAVV